MADDISTNMVLDNGSFNVKAGFAGDDAPREVFRSHLAKNPNFIQNQQEEFLFGNEATNLDSLEEIKQSPFDSEGSNIVNFDLMEKIWHYTFYNQLKIDPLEHALVMIEHLFTNKGEREQKTQIMFETFYFSGFYLANDSVMSLFASGRDNGVVINMGHHQTQTVPICEGYALPHASSTIKIGGKHLTDYLHNKIMERNHDSTMNCSIMMEQVREVKEKLCHVVLDYDKAQQLPPETTNFELPDGSSIEVNSRDMFECPEIYFTPRLIQTGLVENGFPSDSIAEQTYNSICKCDIDYRRYWYSNMVLSGSSSCFKGMAERMTREMVALGPSSMRIKVVDSPNRHVYAWLGGSILGSMSSATPLIITREEYDEVGPTIVHRRCF